MAAGRDRRQADRRDGQGAAVPGVSQRLDDADQGAHRHALDRHPHAGRRQGVSARIWPRSSGSPSRSRGAQDRARHVQRLRRARASAAITSRSSPTATALARYGIMVGDVQDTIATALGGETVTTTVEGRRALHGERALSARPARRPRRSPARSWCRCRRAAPSRSARSRRSSRRGADIDPHRERPARGLHLRRHPRPRHRRLRRRRAARRRGERPVPAGYYVDLERPVRISASAPKRG